MSIEHSAKARFFFGLAATARIPTIASCATNPDCEDLRFESMDSTMVLDFRRVTRGELIAGVAGVALLVIMLATSWYGLKEASVATLRSGQFNHTLEVDFGNAFQSFSFIDVILLMTALAAIALPIFSAWQGQARLPVPPGLVVAGLGMVSTVLIVIRIISPPDLVVMGVPVSHLQAGIEVTRKIGVWLGVVAALGIACAGYAAMRAKAGH